MVGSFWELLVQKAGGRAAFAAKADVAPETVRDWMVGRYGPSVEGARKAAKAAGVSPVAILVGDAVEKAEAAAKSGRAQGSEVFGLATKLARLRDQAADPADRDALTVGVEELAAIISREGLDVPGAAKSEHEIGDDDRDAFGRSLTKTYGSAPKDAKARQAAASAKKSERPDDPDEERDGYGRSRNKLFTRGRNV